MPSGVRNMTDLKETLENVVRSLVDNPDEVTVTETVHGDNVNLTLKVAADDRGLVIGKHGRIAKAIGTVMKAAANTIGKKVNVEIR